MSDKEMEQEIIAKGLTYPRVALQRIDDLLAQVEYSAHVVEGTTTTVVTAILPIGHIKWTLCSEIMACVDPRNFNAELGVKYGIEKAKNVARDQLWKLEGYLLAQKCVESASNKAEYAARLAHEANRAYCESIGDTSQPSWDNAPQWQKASAINGVLAIAINPDMTPEQCHQNWSAMKVAEGWVYGEVKDETLRTHPCLVAYAELPEAQRIKDVIFGSVVRAVLV